ncbi:hypothetical protein AMK26_18305 [Streptomyces sp. CB03234]|uniref:hypothetical protein n=1 Tax=Streptomyces sp. (strain CB03234) TaxID=1703937 RepID=UPI00093B886B|nr:hypothetical protein [Streptomyces sp. CB03234]OKK03452.1 hypothetical protein AMK26_18305 [Streptomyces sp. CB03234]
MSSSPSLATTTPPPTPSQPTRSRRRSHSRREGSSLPWRYVGYVGYYVGAGLISGAVVHHPMAPTRYSMIAASGVLVFLLATVLNDIVLATERQPLSRIARVLGTSTMLSFGLGMLSGGMQHFADLPERCAVLIPLGIVLSFVAFFLKEAKRPWKRIFGLMGLAILVVTALTFLGLRHIAPTMAESGGGHSHSDAEPKKGSDEGEEGDHGSDTTHPPSQPTPSPKDPHPGKEPGHDDGHQH